MSIRRTNRRYVPRIAEVNASFGHLVGASEQDI
jgi:hypothetical protein